MLTEDQRKAFVDFHNSPQLEAILGAKTAHMIKIAAAMAYGCYP